MAAGWETRTLTRPSEVVPGGGGVGGLTCGSLTPVVTAGARCPLPAGSACSHRARRLRSRPVADACGAPVLRDQGPDRLVGHGRIDPRPGYCELGKQLPARLPAWSG
jgi:hypothetical protein